MKKIIYLFLSTAAIVSAIFMSGYFIDQSVEDVYVYTVKEENVDNVVTVQGTLSYGSEKSIKISQDCIINDILVADGDTVSKGDALFTYYEIGEYTDSLSEYDYSTIAAFASEISDELASEYLNGSILLKTMYSDYSGTVSGILSSGYVSKNTAILKITDKSSLVVPVNINETSVLEIELDQTAEITFTAIPDKTFYGTVTNIAEEAKQTTGLTGKETTVEVTITIDGEDEELRAGYTASCSIITSTDDNVLIVPYECVRSDNTKEYAYIYSNGKAVKQYIETGTEYKKGVLVISGLKRGDVLIKNCDTIYDGQSVNIIDEDE